MRRRRRYAPTAEYRSDWHAIVARRCSHALGRFLGGGGGRTLDRLRFEGEGLTARNLLLTQDGFDSVVRFEGVADLQVTLAYTPMFQLANRAGRGNLLFDGDDEVRRSFDVIRPGTAIRQVRAAGIATFLDDLDNAVDGRRDSDDVINGQGGDDRLHGLSGDDLLRGGAGNDFLYGDEGDDRLDGGAGRDLLFGGAGNDVLVGGRSRDLFVVSRGAGSDAVADFELGIDRLALVDGLQFGDLARHQAATATEVRLATTGDLLMTLDGIDAGRLGAADFRTL